MPGNHPSFFFPSSQSVNARLGEMFGFTWSSYAGLRELWWQVRGFKAQFPQTTVDDLKAKFLGGIPLPGGIDLDKVCLQTPWDAHEAEFAKQIVFEACTLYESWAERVCTDIFPAATRGKHAKNLQFPTGSGGLEYTKAVAAANAHVSPLIAAELFPVLKQRPHNCWSTIDEHLHVYRYFKGCRNALIHSDGIVSQDLLAAKAKILALQAQSPGLFRHPFALGNAQPGERIIVPIRDAILLTAVVRRLITTFDAALCVAAACEPLMRARVKAVVASSGKWQAFPVEARKRDARALRLLSAARIPAPRHIGAFIAWMQAERLVT
jgi:hypothetical protein